MHRVHLEPTQKVGHWSVHAPDEAVDKLGHDFLGTALEHARVGVDAHALAGLHVKGVVRARAVVEVVHRRAQKVAARQGRVEELELRGAAVEIARHGVTRAHAVAVAVLGAGDVVANARNRVARARREARGPPANGALRVLQAAADGVALQQPVGVVVEAVKGVRLRKQKHASASSIIMLCMGSEGIPPIFVELRYSWSRGRRRAATLRAGPDPTPPGHRQSQSGQTRWCT